MKLRLIIILFVFFSCSQNTSSYLQHINGYWEIEKVELYDGTEKVYKYNETIDYIEINDSLKGFRKKLRPVFNNTYVATQDAKGLTAKIENDSLNLYYKTPYASWKETVLLANENQLQVINANKDVYIYKRFKGLDLDIE